jgi:hypothetical protein
VLPWAAAGLLVLRAARALPWPEQGRGRVVLGHFALAAPFIALTTAGWYALFALDRYLVRGARPPFNWRVVPWQALLGSLIYPALVCAAYAQQYAAQVREQSARAARAEVLRATAELAALRSQLNPHFILNTLHTLLGLVRRQPGVAEQAIERIGDLLRYGLRCTGRRWTRWRCARSGTSCAATWAWRRCAWATACGRAGLPAQAFRPPALRGDARAGPQAAGRRRRRPAGRRWAASRCGGSSRALSASRTSVLPRAVRRDAVRLFGR